MNDGSGPRGEIAGRGAPTLADVARIAGVSVSTAGRVLRGQDWPVDAVLKERVLAAAAELSYVPNVMARSLRAGVPALIGLVVGNMLDPYYGEIAESVTRHAEATSKVLVMVCNMQRDPGLELDYCQRLWEHRVGGLILAGGGFDQFTHQRDLEALIDRMARSGVVITTLSPRDLAAPAFCVDNHEAGRLAAIELVTNGHRRIGVLAGTIHNRALQARLRGMEAVFAEFGAERHLVTAGADPASFAAGVAQLLSPSVGVTALIAASSASSATLLHAVGTIGCRVPDDVSAVCIGGSALSDWSAPSLTRVDIALGDCGRAAFDFIAGRMAGKGETGRGLAGTQFQPRLVPGRSVARRI